MTPALIPRSDLAGLMMSSTTEQVAPGIALQILKRRKLFVVGLAIVFLTLSMTLIWRIKSTYVATATVMIETRKSAFSDLQASGEIVTSDVIALRTQADIIQSNVLTGQVVKHLDLVHAPEYERILDAPPSVLSKLISTARTKISALFSAPVPKVELTPAQREQTVASIVRGQIVVENVGRSYAMDIQARTGDPELSAMLANAYADAYLAFNRQQKESAIARGTDLLEAQIGPLRDRARTTEAAVEQYRETNGLIMNSGGGGAVGRGTTLTGQQLYQLNSDLSVASADLAQKQASLQAVQSAISSGRGLYSLPEVLASPIVQKLQEQEGLLRSRQAIVDPTTTVGNPLTRSTLAELGAIRKQMDNEVTKIVGGLRNQVAAGQARRDSLSRSVQALQSEVATQNRAEVTLKQLESEAEAARSVYRSFLARHEQISSQVAMQEPDASLVSAAPIPLVAAGPPRMLYAALATMVSLVASALLTLVFDRVSGGMRIRTLEQLESATGLFPLGSVPMLAPRRAGAKQLAHMMASRRAVELIRESFRRTERRGRAQVVMVTSALPEEGKTWLAISLSTNAQRAGERTLLIDWDTRRPSVARCIGLLSDGRPGESSTEGLPYDVRSEVLPGLDVASCRLEDVKRTDGMPSAAFHELLKVARQKYDLVVVDTPPLLLFSDAATLAPLTDGVIMVVRWQQTTSAAVKDALQTLRMCGAHVIGGVLTRVRAETLMASEPGGSAMYQDYARYMIKADSVTQRIS